MVMVMVINDLLPPSLCNVNRPSHSGIRLFQNLTMKIHGQGHVWSKVKVMFDLQNSKVKVMVKVKPIGHIWGLEFNRYVCFSFRGNRTTFGWDIGNSIFDLENSRSKSWPGQTRWSHLRLGVQSICLLFVSWLSDHFWLRYSKFYIWPWKFKVKVMA